jgi:hypothetical protein
MRTTTVRQCLGAGALAAALFVAACSGQFGSASMGPSGLSTGGSLATEIDPCAPALAAHNTVDVPPPPSCLQGRFTGGGFQIDALGVKVTRGFTLHCDALLSNNFEVNWPAANNFHIDKNQAARCSLIDDPNPPDAPVNRIDITGTGTLNGEEGHTVTLVLIDNGEKAGAPPDQAYIAIDGVAITAGTQANPAPIDGGNIQAHFDQPHK